MRLHFYHFFKELLETMACTTRKMVICCYASFETSPDQPIAIRRRTKNPYVEMFTHGLASLSSRRAEFYRYDIETGYLTDKKQIMNRLRKITTDNHFNSNDKKQGFPDNLHLVRTIKTHQK